MQRRKMAGGRLMPLAVFLGFPGSFWRLMKPIFSNSFIASRVSFSLMPNLAATSRRDRGNSLPMCSGEHQTLMDMTAI